MSTKSSCCTKRTPSCASGKSVGTPQTYSLSDRRAGLRLHQKSRTRHLLRSAAPSATAATAAEEKTASPIAPCTRARTHTNEHTDTPRSRYSLAHTRTRSPPLPLSLSQSRQTERGHNTARPTILYENAQRHARNDDENDEDDDGDNDDEAWRKRLEIINFASIHPEFFGLGLAGHGVIKARGERPQDMSGV